MSGIAISRTTTKPNGQTFSLKEVIGIAIESISGDIVEWAHEKREILDRHVVWYVGDYALKRGVILDPDEIMESLDELLRELGVTAAPEPDRRPAVP